MSQYYLPNPFTKCSNGACKHAQSCWRFTTDLSQGNFQCFPATIEPCPVFMQRSEYKVIPSTQTEVDWDKVSCILNPNGVGVKISKKDLPIR